MQALRLYQKYRDGRHWEHHPTAYAEAFADFLKGIGFGGTVVDIGCGTGRDVNFFAQNGLDAMGIDSSPSEVEGAGIAHPGLRLDVMSAESLKFQNGSVGAFYMVNVIHYVDAGRTIGEIFRALAPLGYFFVHFNLEIKDINGNIDYVTDPQDIAALVSKFKIVHQRIFLRNDSSPIEHTHRVLELILQKPY
jgi:SAM-dependent methyltransferase